MSTRPRELNPCSSILFSLFRFISSFSINNLPCTHIHVLCKQLIAIYHKWFYFQKYIKSNFQFQDEKIANLSKIKLAPKEKIQSRDFSVKNNVLFFNQWKRKCLLVNRLVLSWARMANSLSWSLIWFESADDCAGNALAINTSKHAIFIKFIFKVFFLPKTYFWFLAEFQFFAYGKINSHLYRVNLSVTQSYDGRFFAWSWRRFWYYED